MAGGFSTGRRRTVTRRANCRPRWSRRSRGRCRLATACSSTPRHPEARGDRASSRQAARLRGGLASARRRDRGDLRRRGGPPRPALGHRRGARLAQARRDHRARLLARRGRWRRRGGGLPVGAPLPVVRYRGDRADEAQSVGEVLSAILAGTVSRSRRSPSAPPPRLLRQAPRSPFDSSRPTKTGGRSCWSRPPIGRGCCSRSPASCSSTAARSSRSLVRTADGRAYNRFELSEFSGQPLSPERREQIRAAVVAVLASGPRRRVDSAAAFPYVPPSREWQPRSRSPAPNRARSGASSSSAAASPGS